MKHLAEYTLNQLKNLTLEDLNKFDSNLKRLRTQYLFFRVVGTKKVQYSEKGQLETFAGNPVMVDVNVKDWVEVSKRDYDIFQKGNLSDYMSSIPNIEKSQSRRIVYQNKILDDMLIATDELNESKNFNNIILIKEQLLQLAFDYSMDLYSLNDEYGVAFLETKALDFESYANDLRQQLVTLKKDKENHEVSEKQDEKQRYINELLSQRRLIDEKLKALNA